MENNLIRELLQIESVDMVEPTLTDCGGLVDDYGGVITMSNMSAPGTARLFDCIWLVKPLADYQQNPKSHLLVRVEQFGNLGNFKLVKTEQ